MGEIETLQDIKLKIEEIKNSDFKIEDFNFYGENHKICILLRNAQTCINAISRIDDISEETKKEFSKLFFTSNNCQYIVTPKKKIINFLLGR